MFTEQKPEDVIPPEDTPPVDTPPVENPPVDVPLEGVAENQSVKIKELEGKVAEKDTLLGKQDKEIKKQRYTLGKKDKAIQQAKEEGFEMTEDAPDSGVSEERIGEILDEKLQPLKEENQELKNTLTEMARANDAKPNSNPDGGSQKPPPPSKEPNVTSYIKSVIKKHDLKWTGKGRIYKSPKTDKVYDFDATSEDRES